MSPKTRLSSGLGIWTLWIAFPTALGFTLSASPNGGPEPCSAWALEALRSCKTEATSDFWLARAKCTNLPTDQERLECTLNARAELEAALEECEEQYGARLGVCARLGGGIYHPLIDPQDFVPLVDNPYFPLLPGTTLIYEKNTEDGIEHLEVAVTHRTKEILGVTCTVVHAVESLAGAVTEDTLDWFAQDVWGNVWYFGELTKRVQEGQVVSLGGSWEAGQDGAKPGIIMEAAPEKGDLYRQEFLIGEAEDLAGVLSLSASITVHYGMFTDCLQTLDFTPIEPGNAEYKYYAPGVGLILEADPESGERLELIDIQVR